MSNEETSISTSGTYTLLFTDMEGSSGYAKTLGKDFEPIHKRHNEIMDACAKKWIGPIHQRQGDSYFVTFRRASEAASFAIEAMQELESTEWKALNPAVPKLRVRIGMHTGYLEKAPERIADDEFIGAPANKAHRVMEAAHGGQILCSETTYREMLDSGGKPANCTLEPKGHFNLKGVGATELVQITGEGLQKKFDPAVRATRFNAAHQGDFDEAEKEYRTSVRNKLDKMELFGADLNEEETYPLETAYISLRFQDASIDTESFFDRLEPGGALVHIEGDAGSGKSTFLKKLAWDLRREGKRFPILIRISEFDQFLNDCPLVQKGAPARRVDGSWLPYYLGCQKWGLEANYFEEQMDKAETTLLLDGLLTSVISELP